MSKRAKEMALRVFPVLFSERNGLDYTFQDRRNAFEKAYEQAEKDTIEKAAKWIRTHWREYIMGPDAHGCIGFGHWENDFRKDMGEL